MLNNAFGSEMNCLNAFGSEMNCLNAFGSEMNCLNTSCLVPFPHTQLLVSTKKVTFPNILDFSDFKVVRVFNEVMPLQN